MPPRTSHKRSTDNEDIRQRRPKRVKKTHSTTTITRNPSSKKPPYTSSQTESLVTRVNNLRLNQFASKYRVPVSLAHFTANDGREYEVQLSSSVCMEATLLEQLCDLVEETSAKDYEDSSKGWDYAEKKAEMRHPHMKYLLPYEKGIEEEEEEREEGEGGSMPASLGPWLAGFCSFMVCRENQFPVIYIYEIHLFDREGYRRNGVGKKLMQLVETIGKRVGVVKSMLTVFTKNVRAEKFYRSLGYSEDVISPTIKVLKNGKMRRPEYFILSKSLLPHDMEEENGMEKERDKDTEVDGETAQVDVGEDRNEEDVALVIYDATSLFEDEYVVGRSESSENSVLL